MNLNIAEMSRGYLNPAVVNKVADMFGETPAHTQDAFNGAISTVVGGFANKASSDPSGVGISRTLMEYRPDEGFLDNVPSMLGGESKIEAVAAKGHGLLGAVLGDKLPSAVDQVAERSGVSKTSAGKILDLAAPLVAATVGRASAVQRLGPAGIANLFFTGDRAAPGLVGTAQGRPRGIGEVHGQPAGRGVGLPLVLLGGIVLLGLLYLFRGRPPAVPTPAIPTIQVPMPSLVSGTAPADDLTIFFAAPQKGSATRITMEAGFATDSSTLSPAALSALDGIAKVLKAHPTASVRIEGFADTTGDPAHNQVLSMDRANSVRDALIARGVDSIQISTTGLGASRGSPEQTEEQRARSRVVDLVVTQ